MNDESADPIARLFHLASREIRKVIVGQDEAVEQTLIALFAGGHALIEGIPGAAKTLLVRVISRILACEFGRIQFTPDLMPADLIGTNIFNPERREFEFRRGPLFTQILLADEINRAPAKTQSALLESMQERQITVDGVTRPLAPIFTVFATQNPVEQEGTYPLPEAQLDRFMLKVIVSYPTAAQEVEILRVHQRGIRSEDLDRFNLQVIGGVEELERAREEIRSRSIRDELLEYIAKIVRVSRDHPRVEVGASPRCGLMLLSASKARAALYGRGHVLPDDVKSMAASVLRHRLVLKPGAEVDGLRPDDVIAEILARTEIPR